MVEKADASEGHSHSVLVASGNNMVIAYTTTCLGYILYTALVGTFDVVAEGEECI